MPLEVANGTSASFPVQCSVSMALKSEPSTISGGPMIFSRPAHRSGDGGRPVREGG